MRSSQLRVIGLLVLMWVGGRMMLIEAHQDPCHRLHSCPSDHGTYVCGDKGRCNQCPDNQYCLARKARPASVSPPAPAPFSPVPSTATSPSSTTVCFTPGGTCTDQIVRALHAAKRSILVQAYSFTSAPIARPCSRPISAACGWRPSSTRVTAPTSTPPPISWPIRGCPRRLTPIMRSRITRSSSSTASSSSPGRSISPRRRRKGTQRTCCSSGIRHWRTSTPRTGRRTPGIVSPMWGGEWHGEEREGG